jgi:hypothetical protein
MAVPSRGMTDRVQSGVQNASSTATCAAVTGEVPFAWTTIEPGSAARALGGQFLEQSWSCDPRRARERIRPWRTRARWPARLVWAWRAAASPAAQV